ncbi:MAG: orotidine-5-phosphate decarboxylase [Methanobacterium sp.]|jgi:orotidine-5'-phosphate decarboxylase|uniref:orotidine-5'-phosphate decarboxylase n=1 Tax=Methanobacterium sp. TaxID=2164 RepID=UPI0003C9BB1C|nr:orotidine-5'-phosphate decarboxylase [Methanobacterium sp.]MDI3550547.1 orotidine-5-phosphate decarboxylase [Methanobacterium sp.]CDG64764.1 Orotidine 5'-phosphate decarboxylase [Methanobacterium sp. MB1]
MEVKNKIILALDVLSMDQARKLLDEISDYLDTIKIGYPLVLAEGLEAVTQVKEEYNCKIITDFKVADIPATNQKIAEVTFQAGADAIIVHGFVGPDSVDSCVESAKKHGKEVFLLTEMSHPGASQFLQPVSMDIARMGVDMGIQNYVGPSTRLDRLEKIRNIIGEDSFLISPGVGTQGGNPKDTLNFADALIIGRSIYLAPDPVESLESIIDSIEV